MCKVGVRACIFCVVLFCLFVCFVTLWEEYWRGFSWKFFSRILFLLPWPLLLSLWEFVASLLPQISAEEPQCVPPRFSLGRAKAKLCPGPSAPWVPTPFQAAENPAEGSSREGLQFVRVRKRSHSPMMWWSQLVLSSSVLRNILHLESWGAPRAIFGAFPGRSPEPHRAGPRPQPLLGSPQSPERGAPPLPLPLPWRCGKRHQK